MKLSELKKTTPLIKDLIKQLKKSTKQAIPIVDIEKTKRVAGASARPVRMVFENGQTMVVYIRIADENPDLFRIDINGKNQPLAGDYDHSYKPSFDASVAQLGAIIKNGQAAFAKKLAKKKVRKAPTGTKTTPKNKSQQRNALMTEATELDVIIKNKSTEKKGLEGQLEKLNNQ
ncbi:hypothetical protein [Psychrobacter sp. W2-37-MNA-CIBAN-0211]|uniref:hypothetical protein n=1 Tax=Psychrobacter sp. W2-37-MNA-CIBAN-0211 TaxID=3140443 RepID=UPI00331E4143